MRRIVLKPDTVASEDDLKAHCKPLIANYKTPRSYSFLTELPKSGPGKILKKDLREPYWAGKERGVS